MFCKPNVDRLYNLEYMFSRNSMIVHQARYDAHLVTDTLTWVAWPVRSTNLRVHNLNELGSQYMKIMTNETTQANFQALDLQVA